MNITFSMLLTAAFTAGILHTLTGPDHYIPFIVLSSSGNWSMKKTLGMTLICGLGHILSAVLVAYGALKISSIMLSLETIEAIRGGFAAWALTVFGFTYALWGLRKIISGRKAVKEHTENVGQNSNYGKKQSVLGWTLFLIFVFGPCEPLIPFILFPETSVSVNQIIAVTSVFGAATLLTMLTVVTFATAGLKRFPLHNFFSRFGHTLAGSIVGCCGLAMTFLGL